VPLRGPTTVRDAFGWGVDVGLDPGTYGQGDAIDTFRISRATLTALSARESLLEAVDGVRSTSPDPYLTYRVVYELTRASAIANETGGEDEAPPDFGPVE
jgi:phospholipid-binding lipoprotein MlaA